jgi:DNA invertase Pin-like site-specific DNA recombinase
MRAVGYTRVSTDEQKESGLGLEAQRDAIRRAAEARGLELVAIHEDAGISGAVEVEERPGLKAALARLRRGDVLLIARRDRLARDPDVCGDVQRRVRERRARIVSANGAGNGDTPTDVLMRRVEDAVAENFRLQLKANTRAALRAKMARGEAAGGHAPYGWTEDGGRWIPVDAEQDVIRDVLAQKARGVSYRAIVADLNARAVARPGARRWTLTHVYRLIRRAREAA